MTDALTWAGTYHGIGARLLLRKYAEQIGLDPAFTIHDREDSADLMNLVRREKGFSKTECQSALDWDPLSASKRDPFERRLRPVALAASELAGVAETVRARVV